MTARAFRQIARELKALKRAGLTTPATLVKISFGERDPQNLSAGRVASETRYACHVVEPSSTVTVVSGEPVRGTDLVALLPGKLIASGAVPTKNDKLSLDGEDYRLVAVATTAQGALYTCLARK